MCKKDRQKIKDYQKEYRKNITNEQKQKYKNNRKQYRENMTDEQKQKIKDYQKQYREIWLISKNKNTKITKNNIKKI